MAHRDERLLHLAGSRRSRQVARRVLTWTAVPSFLEARHVVLDHVRALPRECVPVLDCGGRVVAIDVRAAWDLPAWDNSAAQSERLEVGSAGDVQVLRGAFGTAEA
jgi:hypothetical protein